MRRNGSLRCGVVPDKETEMSNRFSVPKALAAMVIVAWVGPAAAQQTAPKANTATSVRTKAWVVPRTPWGHPDLQGLWNNGTPTPLERPDNVAGREFLSEQEWNAIAEEARTRA